MKAVCELNIWIGVGIGQMESHFPAINAFLHPIINGKNKLAIFRNAPQN